MYPTLPRDEYTRQEEARSMATELGALASTRSPGRQTTVLDLPTYLIAAHQNAAGTLFSMSGNLDIWGLFRSDGMARDERRFSATDQVGLRDGS